MDALELITKVWKAPEEETIVQGDRDRAADGAHRRPEPRFDVADPPSRHRPDCARPLGRGPRLDDISLILSILPPGPGARAPGFGGDGAVDRGQVQVIETSCPMVPLCV